MQFNYLSKLGLFFLFIGLFGPSKVYGTTVPTKNKFHLADSLLNQRNLNDYIAELGRINNSSLTISERLYLFRSKMAYYLNMDYQTDSVQSNYQKARQLLDKIDDNETETNVQFLWANELTNRGQYVEALDIFQNLMNEVELASYDFLPHFYDGYAKLSYQLGDFNLAFDLLKKEAKILEREQKSYNQASVYNNIGILYKKRNQIDSSIIYHKRAQNLNILLKDTINIIKSYNNIGSTYLENGQMERAKHYFQKAVHFAPDRVTQSLKINYSLLLSQSGDTAQAIRLLEDVVSQPDNQKLRIEALEKLVLIYKLNQNFEKALEVQERLGQEQNSLVNEVKIKEIERLRTAFDLERKESKINQLELSNQQQKKVLNQSRVIALSIIAFFSLLLLAAFLYFNNREKSRKIDSLLVNQKLLRAQMNPHFIFNALSNIQSNILKNENEKAVDYLSKFAQMIRNNLEHNFKNAVTLSDELKTIQDYVDLQNARLNHPIDYRVILPEDIEEDLIEIPPMFIQPIVENSIEHGIIDEGKAHIYLNILPRKNSIVVTVEDNGIGYGNNQSNKKGKNGVATKVIKQRLAILSHQLSMPLSFTIKAIDPTRGTGTIVSIELPILN